MEIEIINSVKVVLSIRCGRFSIYINTTKSESDDVEVTCIHIRVITPLGL